MASDVQKCMSVGMDAYLTKPLNSDKLILAFKSLGILKPKAEDVKQGHFGCSLSLNEVDVEL